MMFSRFTALAQRAVQWFKALNVSARLKQRGIILFALAHGRTLRVVEIIKQQRLFERIPFFMWSTLVGLATVWIFSATFGIVLHIHYGVIYGFGWGSLLFLICFLSYVTYVVVQQKSGIYERIGVAICAVFIGASATLLLSFFGLMFLHFTPGLESVAVHYTGVFEGMLKPAFLEPGKWLGVACMIVCGYVFLGVFLQAIAFLVRLYRSSKAIVLLAMLRIR